jgi:hypothetical protein
MRWSRLQGLVHEIWSQDLELRIHCTFYALSGTARIGRYWITLGSEIIWDVPRDFPEERAKGTYNPFASEISALLRAYLDTPRAELLTRAFPADRWSLIEILRVADRRIGSARLFGLREALSSPAARRILELRLAAD